MYDKGHSYDINAGIVILILCIHHSLLHYYCQVGWGFVQSCLVEGVPECGRGVQLDDL